MKNVLLVLLILSGSIAFSQSLFSQNEIAFDGNDLVGYFEKNAVVKGQEKFSTKYNGWTLWFSSAENLKKFKDNPAKYHPAYDGHCAIALTQGSLVRPDFNQFKVQDGELLFFEVRAFFNGKTAWEKDPEKLKILADVKYRDFKKDK